ncbi:MAG: MoaD/ThiS family protein [Gammaproteobacteria bacterium]|nr:MoaD/ThiS family protein [Gammaproteobacteria bacterium]
MRVNVKLLGWMREFLGDGIAHFDEQDFDLADDQTLGQLVNKLGFRTETQFMAMHNGDRVLDSVLDTTPLHDGDQVVFVPPLKGG